MKMHVCYYFDRQGRTHRLASAKTKRELQEKVDAYLSEGWHLDYHWFTIENA